jgi:hypothetical protein
VEAHFYFRFILEDSLDGAILIEPPSGAHYAGPQGGIEIKCAVAIFG